MRLNCGVSKRPENGGEAVQGGNNLARLGYSYGKFELYPICGFS